MDSNGIKLGVVLGKLNAGIVGDGCGEVLGDVRAKLNVDEEAVGDVFLSESFFNC